VLHRLPLVIFAGLVGAFLYAHGLPSWLVYVVRHLVYEFGSHRH
jgi:hypothetical protein